METYENSEYPDIGQFLQQRLLQKINQSSAPATSNPSGFDPYKAMVKRHKIQTGEEPVELPDAIKWPEEDIKELQDYCQKMGIVGFSSRQSPKLALIQLKRQFGDYSDISPENRVPMGYQKIGTSDSKKIILNG